MKNIIKIGYLCAIASIILLFACWITQSIHALLAAIMFLLAGCLIESYITDQKETEARREQSRKVYDLKLMQDREAAEKAYRAAKIADEFARKYQGATDERNT